MLGNFMYDVSFQEVLPYSTPSWKDALEGAAYSVQLFCGLAGINLCFGTWHHCCLGKVLAFPFQTYPLRKGEHELSFVGAWRIEQL